ncbi:MAG: T9SS type A sorting domain-containing protein [Bacteroidales bacterium]
MKKIQLVFLFIAFIAFGSLENVIMAGPISFSGYINPEPTTNITITEDCWKHCSSDLIINANITVTIKSNARLTMKAGTKVVVKPGGKLNIYGKIYSSKDPLINIIPPPVNPLPKTWKGIQVCGKSSTQPSGKLIMNNASLLYAQVGVSNYTWTSFSDSTSFYSNRGNQGGNVIIQRTTFVGCQTAISKDFRKMNTAVDYNLNSYSCYQNDFKSYYHPTSSIGTTTKEKDLFGEIPGKDCYYIEYIGKSNTSINTLETGERIYRSCFYDSKNGILAYDYYLVVEACTTSEKAMRGITFRANSIKIEHLIEVRGPSKISARRAGVYIENFGKFKIENNTFWLKNTKNNIAGLTKNYNACIYLKYAVSEYLSNNYSGIKDNSFIGTFFNNDAGIVVYNYLGSSKNIGDYLEKENNYQSLSKVLFDKSFKSKAAPTAITEDIENNSSMLIAPNPATSNFDINMENIEGGNLRIYNLKGQTVYKEDINTNKININCSAWDAGIYQAIIVKDNKMLTTQKISVVK